MKALALLATISSWPLCDPGLSVDDAVRFALHNSPAIQSARAELGAASAEVAAAKARLGPQVSVTGFTSQGNMPMILQGPMGSDPRAAVASSEDYHSDLNLMLMLPFFTGGYLEGALSAARAARDARDAEADDVAAEVAFMVRRSYAEALYAGAAVEVEQARREAAEAMVSVARAQLETGRGIEATVKRAEAELAEARQSLTLTTNDRTKMLLDLLAEMGASMETLPTLTDPNSFQPVQGSLEEFLNEASLRRGSLRAARQRVRMAEGQLASARGSSQPQIFGFAMGDVFAPKDGMGRRSGYRLGLMASIPVLDGGMRRSEAAAARAMVERAKAELRAMEIRTEREVRQAWLDVETSARNYETAQAGLLAARSSYDVIAVRAEAGKALLVEQLDASTALTRARREVARSTADHTIAKARLLRAVGTTHDDRRKDR